MVDVVILAGGKSTRMKQNKMLLEIDGIPLILHTIKPFLKFAKNIIVVTGKYDKEIRAVLNKYPYKIVNNINYELGMFSSVKTGVKEVKNDFFIIPGDCPFIDESTIEKLLNGTELIRCPLYKNKEGHPIFISYSLKKELLNFDDNRNLKVFRDSHKYEIINVADKFVVTNLNCFLDYTNIQTERKDSTHEN
ncbi:MAG: nucleotidyltransferase family protein [Bacilli bacterium]|nr:nucleotidyltransferase family protein [Bacilli bacterium]